MVLLSAILGARLGDCSLRALPSSPLHPPSHPVQVPAAWDPPEGEFDVWMVLLEQVEAVE